MSQDLSKIKDIPIFFIIGRPRSGTTLLRTLFDAHPNIAIPIESPVIRILFKKYHNVKKWNDAIIDYLCNDLHNIPQFKAWTINIGDIRRWLRKHKEVLNIQMVCKVIYYYYKSFYDKEEIKLIGDKNPCYSRYLYQLNKIFIESKYIFIIRNHIDQISSMRKSNIETKNVASLAYRWKYVNKVYFNFNRHFPDKSVIIHYEDLINKTEETLMVLCDFLNIQFERKMLDFHSAKDKVYAVYSKDVIEKVHKSLFVPINSSKINSGKQTLTEKHLKLADNIVGDFAKKMGYERIYKTSSFLIPILNIHHIFYGWLMTVFLKTIEAMPMNIYLKFWSLSYKIFRKKKSTFKINLLKDE